MPLPPKPDLSTNADTASSSAAAKPLWQLVDIPEDAAAMDGALSDGYADAIAPELPGALLQPSAIEHCEPEAEGCIVRALHTCCASLLWWQRCHADATPGAVQELVNSLKDLEGTDLSFTGDNPAVDHLRKSALATEALLCERSGMCDAWAACSDSWRSIVADASIVASLALAVAQLARNIAWRRAPVMHRGSFQAFCAMQHVPLKFPVPGQRVVILRTGIAFHLTRIRDAVLRPPLAARETLAADNDAAAAPQQQVPPEAPFHHSSSEPVAHLPNPAVDAQTPEQPCAPNAADAEDAPAVDADDSIMHLDAGEESDAELNRVLADVAMDTEAAQAQAPYDAPVAPPAMPATAPPAAEAQVAAPPLPANTTAQPSADASSAHAGFQDAPQGAVPPALQTLMQDVPPTAQQQQWLDDVTWVESQVQGLGSVERGVVAAMAYAAGDIAPFRTRYFSVLCACQCCTKVRGCSGHDYVTRWVDQSCHALLMAVLNLWLMR